MKGKAKVNEITPFGNRDALISMMKRFVKIKKERAITDVIIDYYCESCSLNKLFGKAFALSGTHANWYFEFTKDREFVIYVVIWENARSNKWGERWGEIKITLNDFVPECLFPNYLDYLNDLNKMFSWKGDCQKYSFVELREIIESLENNMND